MVTDASVGLNRLDEKHVKVRPRGSRRILLSVLSELQDAAKSTEPKSKLLGHLQALNSAFSNRLCIQRA